MTELLISERKNKFLQNMFDDMGGIQMILDVRWFKKFYPDKKSYISKEWNVCILYSIWRKLKKLAYTDILWIDKNITIAI